MNDPLIAELFHKEYTGLVRYAEIMYRKFGGYVDPRGRAEEIVQEAFSWLQKSGMNCWSGRTSGHGWFPPFPTRCAMR